MWSILRDSTVRTEEAASNKPKLKRTLASPPSLCKSEDLRNRFLGRGPCVNFHFLDLAMQNTFVPSLPTALLNAFNTNNRINHYLIDHPPAAAWKASPPEGKGRTIQAIVAHMHNVRVMWLTSAAKGSKIPNQLDRAKVTAPQALRAMEHSRKALSVVLGRAITADGHVKGFRPDAIGFPSRRKSCSVCGNGIRADCGVESQTFSP
jgi:hypothetical protein